jgi:hypothetical protein
MLDWLIPARRRERAIIRRRLGLPSQVRWSRLGVAASPAVTRGSRIPTGWRYALRQLWPTQPEGDG